MSLPIRRNKELCQEKHGVWYLLRAAVISLRPGRKTSCVILWRRNQKIIFFFPGQGVADCPEYSNFIKKIEEFGYNWNTVCPRWGSMQCARSITSGSDRFAFGMLVWRTFLKKVSRSNPSESLGKPRKYKLYCLERFSRSLIFQ